MTLLQGKNFLIIGVANERSIAWGISKALHGAGAKLGFTYLNEAIEKRVRPLAASLNYSDLWSCDVQSDSDLSNLFRALKTSWGRLDGIVHAVAYAEREDLRGRFVNTSRYGFHTALDVSAYSLVAICREARELLAESHGSVLTLTYLGSERVVANYNVMGVAKAALEACVRYLAADLGGDQIRVNAISAGPIKTLAAAGIAQFGQMLSAFAEKAPLKRNVSLEDVAGAALFLLGPLAGGVTGEIIYVDCGFNIMGA